MTKLSHQKSLVARGQLINLAQVCTSREDVRRAGDRDRLNLATASTIAKLVKGGRFGQLVVPQGFLLLVLPAYEQLAALYRKELELGFEEMSRITLADGKLILDPRPDGGAEIPGPAGTF